VSLTLAASDAGLPGDTTAKIANEIPAGIIECECKLPNLDLYEGAMDRWFGAAVPTLRGKS
jgi:hypothetical protein